jgi:hypothetical protein
MRPRRARGHLAALCLAVALLAALTGCLRVREEPAAAGKPIAAAQFAGPTTDDPATAAASPTGTPDPATAAASPTGTPDPAVGSPTATAVAAADAAATPTTAATAAATPTAAAADAGTTPTAAATDAGTTPTAAASPTTFPDPYPLLFPGRDRRDEEDGVERDEGRGNRLNVVRLANRRDGQLRIKGNVQLNQIPGDEAKPINQAIAYSSCTDCQTFAVALQLDLISKTAHTIAPENSAISVNYKCTRCFTAAVAVQYVRQVDDPRETPHDVRKAIQDLDRELRRLHAQQRRLTAAEAAAQIDSVVARFNTLAEGELDDRRSRAEREDQEDRKERRGRDRDRDRD